MSKETYAYVRNDLLMILILVVVIGGAMGGLYWYEYSQGVSAAWSQSFYNFLLGKGV